jgi:CO dehydrogenase/acetyl-CoA synthase beta subunit
MKRGTMQERIFVGVFPAGIVYADRFVEIHGDFKRLAFLPYNTLKLAIEKACPRELRVQIEASAANIQAMRGQQYQISTTGQTVLLGGS